MHIWENPSLSNSATRAKAEEPTSLSLFHDSLYHIVCLHYFIEVVDIEFILNKWRNFTNIVLFFIINLPRLLAALITAFKVEYSQIRHNYHKIRLKHQPLMRLTFSSRISQALHISEFKYD